MPKVTQQGEPGLGLQFPYSLLEALLKVLAVHPLNSPENTLTHETTAISQQLQSRGYPKSHCSCRAPPCLRSLGLLLPQSTEACSRVAAPPSLLHPPHPTTTIREACWLVPWTSRHAFSTLPDLTAYRSLSQSICRVGSQVHNICLLLPKGQDGMHSPGEGDKHYLQ